jgi:2-polyprenyl-6-methoxyphenol hydroxylase-like FAD-dependent oxidoreductase
VSSEATDVTQTSAGVTLHLAGGSTAEGQLLIGADGIGSVIRRVLHPAERPPRDSGLVAVRGAVHEAHPHLGGLAAVYYVGPGIESAIVRASETAFTGSSQRIAHWCPQTCVSPPPCSRICRAGSTRRSVPSPA